MIRRLLSAFRIAVAALRGDPAPDNELQLQSVDLNAFAALPSAVRSDVIAEVRAGADPAEAIAAALGAVAAEEATQHVPASAAPVIADETPPEDSPGSLFDFIGECYLDRLTRELEAKHPYALLIRDNLHWAFLEAEAGAQLIKEGVQVRDDETSTLVLRTRMAELTDTFGPAMTGMTLAEAEFQSGRIVIERDPTRSADADLNFLAAWQPPPGAPT